MQKDWLFRDRGRVGNFIVFVCITLAIAIAHVVGRLLGHYLADIQGL